MHRSGPDHSAGASDVQVGGLPGSATGNEPASLVAAELVSVSKAFGPTQALSEVSFALRRGEVLALVGENGAGKSTCVKVLGGVYQPDSGHLRVAGQQVALHSPLDAQRLGIAVVNQQPGLFGDLSIAENVFAGRLPRSRTGLIDHARMRRDAGAILRRVGLNRSPGTLASALRTSEQQLVEIARALAADASVLILDEPTAALSTGEVDRLFEVIGELRAAGVGLMFVGHRLEEIFRICDRMAVLRDGQLVATRRTKETTEGETVRLMVGRALTGLYPKRDVVPGEVVLEVEGLSAPSGLADISLSIRAGEIVGLAGLVGSGRTELARVLFGIEPKTTGSVRLAGQELTLRSSAGALAQGIAYVSEDRRGQSIIEDFSVLDNATLPVISEATRWRLIRQRLEIAIVSGSLGQMNLKFAGYGQPISALSGGNQQKVVLAKWLATRPRLLILDEATQGIDVAAKAEVHRIISELAAAGLAILLISSDMPEILGMSDRVLVMRRGRLAGEFTAEDATQENIATAATGAALGQQQAAPETTAAPAARAPAAAGPGPSRGRRILNLLQPAAARREAGLLGVLVLMVIPIIAINPRFLSAANLSSLSAEAALVGFVAAGELLVVLTRNIDISVASVIGLSAFLFGSFVKDHPGIPLIVPVLLVMAVGLGCGTVNGLVVTYGRVPSIVVTLGTLYVYRGIDSILSNGKEIAPGDIPQPMQDFLSREILGISVLVWLCVLVFAVVGGALRWTLRGRETYEVGSNPDGALLIGVRVNRRILTAFAVSGLLAGLDGAIWALHYGIIDGQSAYGLELTVVAAVVVGGAALRGGYGTALGVVLGTVVLFTIQNVFELAKVNSDDLQALYGAAIIIAVSIDMLIARRASRHTRVI